MIPPHRPTNWLICLPELRDLAEQRGGCLEFDRLDKVPFGTCRKSASI